MAAAAAQPAGHGAAAAIRRLVARGPEHARLARQALTIHRRCAHGGRCGAGVCRDAARQAAFACVACVPGPRRSPVRRRRRCDRVGDPPAAGAGARRGNPAVGPGEPRHRGREYPRLLQPGARDRRGRPVPRPLLRGGRRPRQPDRRQRPLRDARDRGGRGRISAAAAAPDRHPLLQRRHDSGRRPAPSGPRPSCRLPHRLLALGAAGAAAAIPRGFRGGGRGLGAVTVRARRDRPGLAGSRRDDSPRGRLHAHSRRAPGRLRPAGRQAPRARDV